jgi:hypothetical protein
MSQNTALHRKKKKGRVGETRPFVYEMVKN